MGFDLHEPTLASARELGLDARTGDEDAIGAAREDLAAEGLDVVVDAVGRPETLEMANRLVRTGGRIVGVGYGPSSDITLPTPRVVLDEIEVIGSRFAHRDDLERAIALVALGEVKPVVGLVRELEQVNDVFAALESGDIVGRAVLDVAGVRGTERVQR